MGMTAPEIKAKGWMALVKELGYSGATRYILLHEPDAGDYTAERRELFRDVTIDQIAKEIDAKRKGI